MPVTPADLRREVARLRAQAKRQRDEASALDVQALILENAANRLPGGRQVGTVVPTKMQVQAARRGGAAVSAAKTAAPTPFQAALHAHSMSVPQWAREKGLEAEVVKSWLKKPGKGGRRVPRLWADRIAAEFKDPALATGDAWPNGIRE